MDKKGTLILIIGPAGSGKGVLLSYVKKVFPDFFYPVSWVTRAPREGELEGKSPSGKAYKFVTQEEFKAAIERNEFLEWDYHVNNYYGTPSTEVLEALASGKTVFHELEVQGAKQLISRLPREQVKTLFVTAGGWEELRQRILERQTMSEQELEKRREQFEREMLFLDDADFVIHNENGKLEETQKTIAEVIRSIIKD